MIPGIIWLLLVIIAIGRAVVDRRQAVAVDLVSTLAAAMRQHLPLPAALEAAACGAGGKSAGFLWRVALRLVQGLSLEESIRQGCPVFPGYALGLIAAAERAGRLPATLDSLEAELIRRRQERLRLVPATAYALAVFGFMGVVLTVLAVFVLPKFHDIFLDQGRSMPAAAEFLGRHALEVLAAAGVALAILLAVAWAPFLVRRTGRLPWLCVLGDLARWRLPLLGRLERARSRLQLVQWLRLALEGGRTLEESLDGALNLDVNLFYRARLKKWLDRVRSGQDPARSARSAGIGRMIAWALDEQTHRGDVVGSLAMLESICRANLNYRARVAQMVAIPLVILLLAGTVGVVVFSLFESFAAMIRLAMPQ